ncbi:MAG TPA: hypothetical protein VF104_11110 [Burkholderiales bacterium]
MAEDLPFRNFVFQLLVGAGVVMGVIGLFNRLVDPFWYYRDVSIEGINATKPLFLGFERHVKPAILARVRPEAITVGSSLSEVGFDPLNPSFTDRGRLNGYNFAVAGGQWRMTQCYFEYALAHAPVKRAVVEMRPPMNLVDSKCVGPEAGLDIATLGDLLFSIRALRASVQTILKQGEDTWSYTPEGQFFYARHAPGVESRFRDQLSQVFREKHCERSVLRDGPGFMPQAPKGGPVAKLDLSGLRKVVEAAQRKGVELRLTVHPKHAYVYELDARCGESADTWDALRQIALVVHEASGGDERIQFWAFIGYNEVTAEPVREGMKFWQDPLHLNHEVGDMMFEAMFGQLGSTSPVIGYRVTPDNVDAFRRRFEARRRSFIEANPWFDRGLRALLPLSAGD